MLDTLTALAKIDSVTDRYVSESSRVTGVLGLGLKQKGSAGLLVTSVIALTCSSVHGPQEGNMGLRRGRAIM